MSLIETCGWNEHDGERGNNLERGPCVNWGLAGYGFEVEDYIPLHQSNPLES